MCRLFAQTNATERTNVDEEAQKGATAATK